MTATTAETVGERLAGRPVPRRRAVISAVVVGAGTAVLVYRLLRG